MRENPEGVPEITLSQEDKQRIFRELAEEITELRVANETQTAARRRIADRLREAAETGRSAEMHVLQEEFERSLPQDMQLWLNPELPPKPATDWELGRIGGSDKGHRPDVRPEQKEEGEAEWIIPMDRVKADFKFRATDTGNGVTRTFTIITNPYKKKNEWVAFIGDETAAESSWDPGANRIVEQSLAKLGIVRMPADPDAAWYKVIWPDPEL